MTTIVQKIVVATMVSFSFAVIAGVIRAAENIRLTRLVVHSDFKIRELWGCPDEILTHQRSVLIDGHKTSVSLEDAFWNDLKEIAQAEHVSLSGLVTKIDQTATWQPVLSDPPVRARARNGNKRT